MKYLNNIILIALVAILAACSSEDTFERASQISADNAGAYFPSSNKSMLMRGDKEAKTINITVQRTNTSGALTMPLTVVSKTDNLTVPESVTFADGESTATITAEYTDLSTTPKCELAISEEYGNPYTIKDGSTHFQFTVYRLNTIFTSVSVTPYNTGSADLFSNVSGQGIYQLGKDNRFIWKNFLGSGKDLQFRIDGTFNSEDTHKCYGDLIPLNYYYESDEYGWYLMDDENATDDSECAKWTPDGSDTGISDYIYFYYKYNGSSYFYVDFRDYKGTNTDGTTYNYSYGYISSSVINSSSNYNSYYIYFYE